MSHFKRKRCRRTVRCTLCTDVRWMGNHTGRRKPREEKLDKVHRREMRVAR